MKDKPIQYFNKEYVERCRELTSDQILEFMENIQSILSERPEKCHPISLKIEPSLLNAFKFKSKLEGVAYQTQIKKLMKQWLES